jgi:replicative DNA helicase
MERTGSSNRTAGAGAGPAKGLVRQKWQDSLAAVLEELDRARDPEIESSLLGSLILSPPLIDTASARLTASDFVDPLHGALFDALVMLRELKRPIDDTRLLLASLRKFGLVGEGALTAAAILKWVQQAVPANARFYTEEILRASQARQQLSAVIRSIDALMSDSIDPRDSAAELLNRLQTIYSRAAIETETLGESAAAAVDAIEKQLHTERAAGLPTSLETLDEMLGGLMAGELVIIAARPGVGKTALAMQMCHCAAMRGSRVLFVSLEMSSQELATRVLCGKANVNNRHIRQGTLSETEMQRLRGAAIELMPVPLVTYAPAKAGLREIRAAIRQASFREPLGLVCVDYISLIEPEDRRKPRTEQVAEISAALKAMAREFKLPVIALCQLNREAEGERPRSSHLRESGSIEQDADVILAIWRGEEDDGTPFARLVVLKNRAGERGMIELNWRPEATTFEDVAV